MTICSESVFLCRHACTYYMHMPLIQAGYYLSRYIIYMLWYAVVLYRLPFYCRQAKRNGFQRLRQIQSLNFLGFRSKWRKYGRVLSNIGDQTGSILVGRDDQLHKSILNCEGWVWWWSVVIGHPTLPCKETGFKPRDLGWYEIMKTKFPFTPIVQLVLPIPTGPDLHWSPHVHWTLYVSTYGISALPPGADPMAIYERSWFESKWL